ncbi:MAG: hypothetical protein IPJ13_19820 [Saprospiraceae bacterium]|nr:hypothetical protein [Saprospiraceae bacterium]
MQSCQVIWAGTFGRILFISSITNMEQKQIGFVLQGIKTEQFAILNENFNHKKPVELGSQLQFKFDQNQKLIGVEVGFEYIQSKKCC